jgi:hypothetical protein
MLVLLLLGSFDRFPYPWETCTDQARGPKLFNSVQSLLINFLLSLMEVGFDQGLVFATTWAMPSHLFALVIFERGSCIYVWLDLTFNPPVYISCHILPYPFTGWDRGLANFLPRLALNHDSSDLGLPGGWDYRYKLLCLAWVLKIPNNESFILLMLPNFYQY